MKITQLIGGIIKIQWLNTTRDRIKNILDLALFAITITILTEIYSYTLRLNSYGLSFGIGKTIWSIFIFFSLTSFRLTEIGNTLAADIRSGQVIVLLSKPISYLGYRIIWQIAGGIYPGVSTSLFGIGLLCLFVGFPPQLFSVPIVLAGLTLFVFGGILSVSLYSAIGLMAYWLDDISPIIWLSNKAGVILGGSLVPIAFLSPTFFKVAKFTPFGAIYFSTQIFSNQWTGEWRQLLVIQISWIVVCSLIVRLLYRSFEKNLSVNGG